MQLMLICVCKGLEFSGGQLSVVYSVMLLSKTLLLVLAWPRVSRQTLGVAATLSRTVAVGSVPASVADCRAVFIKITAAEYEATLSV